MMMKIKRIKTGIVLRMLGVQHGLKVTRTTVDHSEPPQPKKTSLPVLLQIVVGVLETIISQ
jgi:hypothetical protein